MIATPIARPARLLMKRLYILGCILFCGVFFCQSVCFAAEPSRSGAWHRIQSNEKLPETELLDWTGDFGKRLMDQSHRLLDDMIAQTPSVRAARWNHHAKTTEEYISFLNSKRKELSRIVGIREGRIEFDSPRTRATLASDAVALENDSWKMIRVEWDVFADYSAKGIVIEPKSGKVEKVIVALPHAGMCPKAFFHSLPELQVEAARGKTRIIIPSFLNREVVKFKNVRLPRREIIYRQAYMLGRHLIGYEIETVRAAIDWIKKDPASSKAKIVVGGFGDGGMIALYCGALDERIDEVRLAGYFGSRSDIWCQPLDRNVYGLLNEFGDAELAAMVFPRTLIVEPGDGPAETIIPETFQQSRVLVRGLELKEEKFPAYRWAPGLLKPQTPQAVENELKRAKTIVSGLPGNVPQLASVSMMKPVVGSNAKRYIENPEYQRVQQAILTELDAHTQSIMRSCIVNRAAFMKNLDTSSVAKLEASAVWYRNYFHEQIAGKFEQKKLSFNPRSRKVYDEDHWVAYDVVLDVFDGLSAQGTLVLPKNLKPGEKRSVVVFQHGREGCTDNGINGRRSYNAIVPRLIEDGFIVFCPQNLYIRGDEYRVLQQKCYAVGRTFFGLMIAQHEQIVDWLGSLPYVRKDKIGFYGISYGGKSAMFIPSVVTGYALSVCSADFNERIVKCASTDIRLSFMGTPEYEMYEFDSGDTFSYAEMAMLIAPRPFMVERGHRDGVGYDEYVAFEFARVSRFYDLMKETRCKAVIEYFDGGHEIHYNGVATFLKQYLK